MDLNEQQLLWKQRHVSTNVLTESIHDLWQVPIQGQSGQQVIHPRSQWLWWLPLCHRSQRLLPRVSFNKRAEHNGCGEPWTPAAVLSHSYVTLMQTRLSAADVQPGSGGLLSHWGNTQQRSLLMHTVRWWWWRRWKGGQDASLRAVHRNVTRDGGVRMRKEAD